MRPFRPPPRPSRVRPTSQDIAALSGTCSRRGRRVCALLLRCPGHAGRPRAVYDHRSGLHLEREPRRPAAAELLQGGSRLWDSLQASGKPEAPQSWNRYAYSLNNPLRHIDPSGMEPADFIDSKGKLIGLDGVDNGVLYVVTDRNVADEMRAKNRRGKGVSAADIPYGAGFYLQPAERDAMVDAVAWSNLPNDPGWGDDPFGGFHEEAFKSGQLPSGKSALSGRRLASERSPLPG